VIFSIRSFSLSVVIFFMLEVNQLIIELAQTARPMDAAEKTDILRHISQATFVPELQEVDEALWGGFWQGDVISPGYWLPAVELHLLRAMRLDNTWPETTTVEQFLADLRPDKSNAQVEITWAAGQPGVVVTIITEYITVVRYNALTGYLEAGYRLDYEPDSA
jgi:hypothetical protein